MFMALTCRFNAAPRYWRQLCGRWTGRPSHALAGHSSSPSPIRRQVPSCALKDKVKPQRHCAFKLLLPWAFTAGKLGGILVRRCDGSDHIRSTEYREDH